MAEELNLQAAFDALLARAGHALRDAVVEGPFAVSQERVPLEGGDLQSTGAVSEPVIDGDTITVVASYGNPNDVTGVVAIEQHERTDFAHPNGRVAKYLEGPTLEAAPTLAAQVAAKMGGG